MDNRLKLFVYGTGVVVAFIILCLIISGQNALTALPLVIMYIFFYAIMTGKLWGKKK